jgi:hypothetical protein
MKRILFVVVPLILATLAISTTPASAGKFSWGLHRDSACLSQRYAVPCIFPPVLNPCAVPCRPPEIQKQAVPCAFETACPSASLPCYGVSYGNFPYAIFK